MPISDRASRTSSSLKGLMIAVISFIAIPREGDERIYAISVPIFQDYEKSFVSKIAGESTVLESCVFFALSRPNRSEERRVGKECVIRVDLGGRRIIKKNTAIPQENTLQNLYTR